ncbi:MAG: hypothetical protein PHQ43_15435 [Dehalococcoidales bacterium]|nr:hypothetical protein [Dehalococcoidales bacterium]
MSANNAIYINKETFEVYYQPCVDNDDLGELVGVGKDLEDAVRIAQEQIEECGGMVEYGINFIGRWR